jgi:hypothetical protein
MAVPLLQITAISKRFPGNRRFAAAAANSKEDA